MNHTPTFGQVGSYSPDLLLAGEFPVRDDVVVIASGQNLTRGALLGKITEGARTAVGEADVPAPVAATITASPTATTAAKVGIHRFVCITAGATGKFRHYDPDGIVVGDATTGTEYTGGGLTLTITDAGTDPAVGEAFKVTVTAAAASGKYVLSLAAATDGSQVPVSILSEDVDASLAEKTSVAYITGDFNTGAMTFGTGHTAASVKESLRARSIFLHDSVAAE